MTDETKVEAVVALVRRLEAVAQEAKALGLFPCLSLLANSDVALVREVGQRVGATVCVHVHPRDGRAIEAWDLGETFCARVQAHRPATPEELAAHEAEASP